MAASQNGHVEVVDKLLQHGATVDLKNVVHYNTPQMLVSHNMRVNRESLYIFCHCFTYCECRYNVFLLPVE